MQYFLNDRTPSSAAEFSCTTGCKILEMSLATLKKSIVSFHRGYSTEHVKAADSILLYRTCDSCQG
jgi:hypothetical protein